MNSCKPISNFFFTVNQLGHLIAVNENKKPKISIINMIYEKYLSLTLNSLIFQVLYCPRKE